MAKKIDLSGFYPEYMEIVKITQTSSHIHIETKTKTSCANCPVCGMESHKRNCGYSRTRMQDLPILGKGVRLIVHAQMFSCKNPACDVSTFTEGLPDLANSRGHWTTRCEAMIMAIAVNTSCEAASRICRELKIDVSGDTVIRMLLRHKEEAPYYGEAIGVDDFAMRKGQNYGTLICDLDTHRPITILPGRDGNALKEWLGRNKQVKLVTRDRAGSYAAAIREVLPQAVQVADRFHLYQNLFEAVKDAVNGILPEKIWISDEAAETTETHVKKTHQATAISAKQ